MPQFRKKPVVIEAIQWDGDLSTISTLFWASACGEVVLDPFDKSISIDTIEGDMRAFVGDWIICGVKGEFYPCKPDIFDLTYEAVAEEAELRAAPQGA